MNAMISTCEECEKEYTCCPHKVCGETRRGVTVTHSECDEDGCGECMEGCDGSQSEDYCDDCDHERALDAAADRRYRRAESGYP